jgi:FtsP/CotA-like multicopper oxidase with cupredoxin domain
MSAYQDSSMNRRNFLKAAAILGVGVGGLGAVELVQQLGGRHVAARLLADVKPVKPIREQHVGFTDGWVSMPKDAEAVPPFWPDPGAPTNRNAYVFGIRSLMTPNGNRTSNWQPMSEATMFAQKGRAQLSAPILFADQGSDFRLHLHNLGEQQRPIGNPDNHTIHFHGFTNQIVYFDGVPDNSVAAAIGRELIYHYFPEDPGSYMYHCHIDDVEHVHMGLYGIVFIRSNQLRPPDQLRARTLRYAFNDPVDAKGKNLLPTEMQSWYDREFAMIITEFDIHAHWNDAHNQDTDWTDYKAGFRLMNGRAWPDTIQPHFDPMLPAMVPDPLNLNPDYDLQRIERLRFNPNSALIQANAGERILIRVANLGFEEHSLMLPGIPLTVVGRDAKPLYAGRPDYGVDGPVPGSRGNIQWTSNRVDLGPGESRDMIITVPATSSATATSPDHYAFYDRNYGFVKKKESSGGDGYGGMRTEVQVYPAGTLPDQTRPAGLYALNTPDDITGGWTETWAQGTEPL